MVSVKLAPLAVCLAVVLVCGVAGVDARSKKKSKSNAYVAARTARSLSCVAYVRMLFPSDAAAASGTAHTYLLEHALNPAEPNVRCAVCTMACAPSSTLTIGRGCRCGPREVR